MQHLSAVEAANVQIPGHVRLRAYAASQQVHPWPNSPVQQQCQVAKHRTSSSCSCRVLCQTGATAASMSLYPLPEQASSASSSTGFMARLQPPAASRIQQNRHCNSVVCGAVSSSGSGSITSSVHMAVPTQQPSADDSSAAAGTSTASGAGRLTALLQARRSRSSSGTSSSTTLPSNPGTSITSAASKGRASFDHAASADAQLVPDTQARKRNTSSSNGSSTTLVSQQQQQQQLSDSLTLAELQDQQQQLPSSEPHLQPQQQLPSHQQQQQQQAPLAAPQQQPAAEHQQASAAEQPQPPPAPEQQQQRPQQPAMFDPSELPIMDRVRLLRNRIAARQQPRRNRGQSTGVIPSSGSSSSIGSSSSSSSNGSNSSSSNGSGAVSSIRPPSFRYRHRVSTRELQLQVLNACNAAGIGGAASALLLQHVANRRVSAHPQSLPHLLACYKRLEAQYGADVVQEWLRRAPPVIRNADEVPLRLQQLSQLMGADLQQVLALTRRCPQALQVEAALMAPRLEALCKLLQRPIESEGSLILQAAPALLAMDPGTLAVKVQRLELLAQRHPKWAEAYERCPCKGRAVLLTYSLKRQMRLVFLAQQGLQEKQHRNGAVGITSMSTIMAWSEEKMQQLHPHYTAWYNKHAAAAIEAEQAARAAAAEGSGRAQVHARSVAAVGGLGAAAPAQAQAPAAAGTVSAVPW